MPPSPGLAAGFRRGRASQPDPAFPQSPGFIPGPALSCLTRRRSGDPGHNTCRDFRPMTLRHQVSLILPFGQPVGLDQRAPDFRCLALRHHLSAD
jgi:hypothetical protein